MSPFSLVVICLVCVGPLATLAYPKSVSTAEKDLTCRDYTLDKCTIELGGLIEQVKTTDQEICQLYCDQVYPGRCKFFVFDKKLNLCSLLDEEVTNYELTCKKVAGPKTPSFAQCASETAGDPCNVFVEETCRLEGTLIENLEQIQTKETCQFACLVLPACNYFLYDSDLKDCELFDSEKRNCDIIRGPPLPSIKDCEEPTTTTVATTTTDEPDTTIDDNDYESV